MNETLEAARTVTELLDRRAARTPDAECLRFEGSSLSFAAARERARGLAASLGARGIASGDRVAIMLPNGLEFPVAWLGIPMLGAVVVPVHPGYRGADLAHVIRHSGARTALVGPEQLEAIDRVREECPDLLDVAVLGAGDRPTSLEGPGTPRRAAAGSDQPSVQATAPVTIQYTSGTTGLPKGCVLDHAYWLALARTMQRFAQLERGDVILTAQRQSYMDPSWNLVLGILAGVPLVVLPRFSASGFWRSVRENDVTFFYCIGTMPNYLMKQPADPTDREHGVRLVYCSGIPPALHAAFEERWGCPWRETYGTTELGAVLVSPVEDEHAVGTGTMGRPVPGREVRLASPSGGRAKDGEPAELLVRGEGLMRGYHRDPEATAAWRAGGWAHTGDLVVEDPSGGYRLVGRMKDMIRRAGENVAAAEVEAVLVEHPSIRAAACVPVPDPLRGEEVKAYLQLAVEGGSDVPDPGAIRTFVSSRLAPFKVPRYIEFVDAFPLTASEKVAKAELFRSRPDHRAGSWDGETGEWVPS